MTATSLRRAGTSKACRWCSRKKTTDLSGLVTDAGGKPVLDASVVIFPANRDKWKFQSRYVRTARPDTQGRYNIKSLPPGEDYLVIAVQNLENGQGGDPEFLARAKEEAKPFTLNEGETKAVDVKLSSRWFPEASVAKASPSKVPR